MYKYLPGGKGNDKIDVFFYLQTIKVKRKYSGDKYQKAPKTNGGSICL
jgi:hypothetical protein